MLFVRIRLNFSAKSVFFSVDFGCKTKTLIPLQEVKINFRKSVGVCVFLTVPQIKSRFVPVLFYEVILVFQTRNSSRTERFYEWFHNCSGCLSLSKKT